MSTAKSESDREAIADLWREYAAALRAGDIERWLALWIPTGKQMPPGAPARVGEVKLRQGNQPLVDLFDVEMTITPEDISVHGNLAYSHGEYRYALTPKEGGETIRNLGKFLTILNRQEGGKWQIAVDCFNDNAPLV